MSLRETLIEELATKHPEACQLIKGLIQTIDLEARQSSDCDPEVEEDFCLSGIHGLAEATIDNLAMNDFTPVEADHAFRVMAWLFNDLGRAGVNFESVETEQEIGASGP